MKRHLNKKEEEDGVYFGSCSLNVLQAHESLTCAEEEFL